MKDRVALAKIRKLACDPNRTEYDPHFWRQLRKRALTLQQVMAALRRAHRIRPHDMLPLNEHGESWRVYGKDTEDRTLGVGVELVLTDLREWVLLVTAFMAEEKEP